MDEEKLQNPFGFVPGMTKNEIYDLPLKQFEGRICLIDSMQELERNLSFFENNRLAGFDTESKPSFKKGQHNKVALLQLANHDTSLLIRINKIGLPEKVIRMLSDAGVTKIGVALRDHLTALKQLSSFNPAGFVDLQSFVKDFGIEANGLRTLTAIVLGFRISKSQQVTNWDAARLSESQLIYAATDAWVCHEIYRKLLELKKVNERHAEGQSI